MNPLNNYNDDAKEQVRTRADIAVVIGRYVNLKAHGQVLKGLCPFHNEKTPSFHVNPDAGFYHCFGCGKGGDVFNFVQEIEGVGFREALEMLADETGIILETKRRAADSPDCGRYGAQTSNQSKPASKPELLAIHDEAAKYYYGCIKKHPQSIDYFKSRGLEAAIVKEFRLGYAPAGWTGLCDYLQGKDIPQPHIIECGLAIAKDGGGVYDRFRDRIIFPLCDLSGRVIAFAGRGLDAAAQPKYLNSPETALYRKSGTLYGLHKARPHVRESGSLLIVEGYMDYLTLYQAGIRNAAAVSGTAFTADHARLIKRFAPKVTLVFDGDRAGQAAAQKAVFTLAPFNLQVQILTLPAGDDPDTFVKREGAAAFSELVSSAKPAEDFLIDKLIAENDDSPHSKSRIVDQLAPYAQSLADTIVRDDFLARVALRLRVDRRHIFNRANRDASRTQPDSAGGGQRADRRQIDRGRRNTDIHHNPAADSVPQFDMDDNYYPPDDYPHPSDSARPVILPKIGALEESFLRILLTAPELIATARQYIPPEILTDAVSANVYSTILNVYEQSGSLDGLSGALEGSAPEIGRLVSMLAVKPAHAVKIIDELAQKILLLRRKHLKVHIAGLRAELANCPEPDKGRLLEEIKDCGERLRELDPQG